ncbi:hypothetical protein HK405_012844, partial [Cladochytrium tenue]
MQQDQEPQDSRTNSIQRGAAPISIPSAAPTTFQKAPAAVGGSLRDLSLANATSGVAPQPSSSVASRLEDYRLMCKLGEGTFSEVLKVKHKRTGRVYAMKRFRKTYSSLEEVEGLREIQALRRLNPHPNIVDLVELVFEPSFGILGLNFELMECNLYEFISKKQPQGQSGTPEPRAKVLLIQVCRGLEYMHSKGIFHRDIKPENILIKGNTVKLADLGSCRGIHSRQPYTEYIATRWYRAPECLLCDGLYSQKMDVWAVGCVLYELLTSNPLFPGSNEVDQIHRIHAVLGTPSPKEVRKDTLPALASLQPKQTRNDNEGQNTSKTSLTNNDRTGGHKLLDPTSETASELASTTSDNHTIKGHGKKVSASTAAAAAALLQPASTNGKQLAPVAQLRRRTNMNSYAAASHASTALIEATAKPDQSSVSDEKK